MKKLLFISAALILPLFFFGQGKSENLIVGWPAEYRWKTVAQREDSLSSMIIMIPGKEKTKNASILAQMKVFNNIKYGNSSEIERFYRKSLDIGTTMTLIKKSDSSDHFWILFKTETTSSEKYPEPESDLYFVIQGEYGLFQVNIAIRKPHIDEAIISKWSDIFLHSQFITQ